MYVFHPNPLRFPQATPRRTGCANKGVATGRRGLNLCTFTYKFFHKNVSNGFSAVAFPAGVFVDSDSTLENLAYRRAFMAKALVALMQ